MKNPIAEKEQKTTTILKPKKRQISTSLSFPIVGMGASAGGLEALEQFFTNMPKDSGMAFVVIQHLDPTHEGVLPELLQRKTDMKVTQVTDHLQVKPNHVYVIPSNKSISILNGYLHLFEPTEKRGLRLPIDIFFRSLADDQQEKSIGIILSGMGSDGSLGVKAIKEKNGIVLVQDPLTAKFDSMPNSALTSVNVDIKAEANELPAKLISFLKFIPAISQITVIDDNHKTNIDKIVILLRTQTGYDFSFYKKNTLFRRIERRMVIHQIDKIANYVRFLQDNPNELDILFKEFLIGVTNFFRDAPVWQMLKEKVLPDLFNELPNGYALRAWITGCSTGEEAYSLAILFKEAYEKVKQIKKLSFQIFATDIDSDAIEIARKGVFSPNIVADVSSERLSQFFTSNETNYNVNTSIREMILFAPHDVTKDPPFTKLDFILCRNLLIYMENELQGKLMNLFYYSLNTGGLMLLGSAESVNTQDKLFTVIDKKLKLYKRSNTTMEIEMMDFPSSLSPEKKRTQEDISPVKAAANIQTLAEQLLLQRFAPASVLINQEGDILNFIGRTGKYLEHATGKTNVNIYAMACEGLRNELAGAIRKAKQNYEPVILRNIKVGNNEDTQIVNVTFQAIEKPNEFKGTIMIVFADVTALQKPVSRKPKTAKQTSTTRENELEIDLQHTIVELQNTREEMLSSQEELKSTNEELQSTNEEMQSTNEELLTSKEEMQSMNEELLTVNIELQSKIADFIAIDSDMKNLLNSTEIATLFLDKEFKIRKFTEKLINIIKLRPIDIGRPFTEMVSDLQYPAIADHAREVLRTLISKESVISTKDQRWFTVRIMPYVRLDNKIDGVVITFINITVAKNLEAKLAVNNIEEKEKRLAELVIANKELEFQNKEKHKRADELVIANKELANQNKEKQKRANELVIANKELVYQNEQKEKRADELAIANKELAYQNEQKEKRADELVIANKELEFQNKEKQKRADELAVANKELIIQNKGRENMKAELTKTINILREHNLYKP
jgi:two-component system CheB/CheR fusion protein